MGFRWLGKNYTEMAREAGKLQGWGIVALTFEMDQNWNQLDTRNAVCISKTIFQYFYYLVSNTSIFKLHDIFYIESIFY